MSSQSHHCPIFSLEPVITQFVSASHLMNRITEFNPLTYFRLVISCNDNTLTSCCIGLTLNSCEESQNQNVKVLWGPEKTMKKRKWWGDSDTHADIPGQPSSSIMITRLSFGLGKTHPFDDQATVQAWPLSGHLPGLMSGTQHDLLWSLNTDDADWNADTWTTCSFKLKLKRIRRMHAKMHFCISLWEY